MGVSRGKVQLTNALGLNQEQGQGDESKIKLSFDGLLQNWNLNKPTKETTDFFDELKLNLKYESEMLHNDTKGFTVILINHGTLLYALLINNGDFKFDNYKYAYKFIKDNKNKFPTQLFLAEPNINTAKKWSLFITNAIYCTENHKEIPQLFAGTSFGVSYSTLKAKQLMNNIIPENTVQRMEYAATLYRIKKEDNDEVQQVDIATAGCYTDFLEVRTGVGNEVKMQPILVLSNIASLVMSPVTMAPLMALSVAKFLPNWVSCFKRMDVDLGNLFLGEAGKPLKCKNEKDFDNLINSDMFLPPIFAIDVNEGHSNIPMINEMIKNPEEFCRTLLAYFGIAYNGQSIVQRIDQYAGTYALHSEQMDDRHLDYLSLVKAGVPAVEARQLLRIPQELDGWFKVRNKFANYNATYINHRYILHGSFVNQLIAIANKLDIHQVSNNQLTTSVLDAARVNITPTINTPKTNIFSSL